MLKNIDEYKFGKDVQPKVGEAASQEPCYSCNGGCKSMSKGPRYICLTCRPGPLQNGGYIDFCNWCETVIRDEKHENHEELI